MTPNPNQNADQRPLISIEAECVTIFDEPAVTDPVELTALKRTQERPIWSFEVNEYAEFTGAAITDPKQLQALKKKPSSGPPGPPNDEAPGPAIGDA